MWLKRTALSGTASSFALVYNIHSYCSEPTAAGERERPRAGGKDEERWLTDRRTSATIGT